MQSIERHCKSCGKLLLPSKIPKDYCGMECFQPEALEKTAPKKRVGKFGPARSLDDVPCAYCGKPMHMKPIDVKRNKKTCSRDCYRLYMAGRFDRLIETPVTFKDMHNFDEYLTQDKLPCLVLGCNWVGDNLTLHMNQAHGIKAEDFKREVGFNKSTGVVSRAMSKNLRERAGTGNIESLNQPKAIASRGEREYRKERIEHMSKSGYLREEKKRNERNQSKK